MRGRRALAFIVPGFVATFGIAVAAGYLMGQTSFRVPPPGLALPTVSPPGVAVPPSLDSHAPAAAEPSPASPPQADQPGGAESPQNPPLGSTMPSESSGGPPGNVPPASAPPPSAESSRVSGPTAVPAIPGPPTRFHVQVGSFADRDAAMSLVQQLRDHGFAVTLVEGLPYRVWVGGYLDRTTAERLAANLKSAGYDATLTPR